MVLLLALGLAVTGLAGAGSAGAAGKWLKITERAYAQGADLQVARTATLRRGGFAVDWEVRFTCPKGQAYTLSGANLGNLNPDSVPPLQDGDGWIYADLDTPVTGTCAGHWQVRELHLVTNQAQWGDTTFNGVFYPAGSCWCPLVPDDSAETNVRLNGRGFSAVYAANVGATTSASERVALVRPRR
jgi:hypothetical protein